MALENLVLQEGLDTEYKSGKGGLPKSLWETYSAFANTQGGIIYIGISENYHDLDIHGLADPEKMRTDVWNLLNNAQKVSQNILQDRHVTIQQHKAAKVLVIEVPRADYRERPVYIGVDPYKGSYRRNHEGDFRCNRSEVRRMFADRMEDIPVDSRILPYFNFDDLDPITLRQFRNRMASHKPNHPWLLENDEEFLGKLGGWRIDRKTKEKGLTLAGLLMFGRTETITDVEALPGFHLDYRERLAEDDNIRWSDRLTVDGTWEANLFQFYHRIVQKIEHDAALKIPFQRDAKGYRKGQTEVHEALQEALVNALIHADHSGQGGIIVERYKDRFEFSNPGTLLLSMEQLLRGGVSECRNKALQNMFQLLGAGDKAGSGLDKIRRSWKTQHWQSPSLKETLRPDRVILTLPISSMLPTSVMKHLTDQFGSRFSQATEDEVHALVIAKVEDIVTNQRLQETLTCHRVDITQMLRGLIDKGILQSYGQGRGTYYRLADDSLMPAQSSLDLENSSLRNDDSFLHKEPSSLHKEASLLRKNDSSLHNDEHTQALLEKIAQRVNQSKRSNPSVVEKTILDLCSVQELSLQEIASFLKRDAGNLQTRYITPLIKRRKLTLRFPDKPNHNQQRYRTSSGNTT